MNQEGKILEEYLKKNRMTAQKLADKISVSKQAVYAQIGKSVVSVSFKEKLESIGIDIFKSQPKVNSSDDTLKAKYITVLEENYELHKEIMKLKEELNSLRVGKSNR